MSAERLFDQWPSPGVRDLLEWFSLGDELEHVEFIEHRVDRPGFLARFKPGTPRALKPRVWRHARFWAEFLAFVNEWERRRAELEAAYDRGETFH